MKTRTRMTGDACCGGGCGDRRIYLLFLTITIFQIVLTIARWVMDFLGPLWSLILTDFLNIVFAILGFSGGYAQIRNYLFTYIVWSLLWLAWNVFIVCLYVPLPQLEMYKSLVLSLGTGGFSYWETRAPGCEPDWASENKLIVNNCMFDPRLMEFIQSGVQVVLSLAGVIVAFIILCRHDFEGVRRKGGKENAVVTPTVPSFLGSSSGGTGSRGTLGSRMSGRRSGAVPSNTNGDSSDQVAGVDDRLRPMTPRRVKRRSARSIQSHKFGRNSGARGAEEPSTSRGGASSSARSSLRSNTSRRSHRSSKRKQHQNQFISPVNRLMQQVQQVDSEETSHEEPGRYTSYHHHHREQGHVNPVYVGPQSQALQPPPPPRPTSARSSYSNYHPARLPQSALNHPNVFNLNQNIFTNGGFDMSTEYNMSQPSEAENNSNNGNNLYEEDINFLPDPSSSNNVGPRQPHLAKKLTDTMNTTTTMALTSPPQSSNASSSTAAATPRNAFPNGFSFSFNPHHTSQQQQQQAKKINNNNHVASTGGYSNATRNTDNQQQQTFAYPLAHSPVSQVLTLSKLKMRPVTRALNKLFFI